MPVYRQKFMRRRRHNRGGVWKKRLLSLLLIGFLGSVLFGVGAFAWFSRDLPNPNKLLDRAIPLSTKIYDRTGTHILYDIHGKQQRTLVSINDIPDHLKWAAITAEDRGFYEHQGFDLKGIFRALFIDLIRGRKAQGGSTITQQFIKNSLVGSRKTVWRKIKELVLAYQLERNFTKDQILQLYFNEIPYGSTAYGIQSASEIYFDKDMTKLSLAESAVLAALPKAPTYYSPWGDHRDLLIARQHSILDAMVDEERITKEEAESAKKEKLHFKKSGQSITAPHFVFYIRDQLISTYGEQMVEEGGLKVITTLDFDKQKIAEDAVTHGAIKNTTYNASNAAMVSLDAHSGEILAMVGSKDYFNEDIDGNVNVVIQKRQPGSSFKPIVYAAAWEKGYTPQTIVFDLKTNFDTTGTHEYSPQNYTLKEYGPIQMKKALAGSLNIAAVKTLYLAGVGNVIKFAQRLNYSSLQDPDRYGLALVLGGAEVTLLEHASSFSAFARDGEVVKPISVLKVEDKNGVVLEEFSAPKKSRAFDAQIARQINDTLSDNSNRAYVFGDHNYLTIPDRPVAAKTGTTNDFRDAWTIGYTPSIVTGVWVGNNRNSPMKKGADGSQLAAPIWNEYMKKTLSGTPVETFTKPDPVTTGKSILDGGTGDERKVKIDKTTGTLATDQTPPELVEEKTYRTVHDILYYVNKDDPRGAAPNNPASDPQFTAWEAVVRAWVEKNHIEEIAVPTETDNIHVDANKPIISIATPKENDTINHNPLQVSIQAIAPRGVRRVEYFLDDALLDTVTTQPFNLEYPISGIESGFHTLIVKGYDDAENMGSAQITLNFLVQKKYPSVSWNLKSAIIPSSGGQLDLSVATPNTAASTAHRLVLFATSTLTGSINPIATLLAPPPAITQVWTPPATGEYILTAQLFDRANQLLSQKRIRVVVK